MRIPQFKWGSIGVVACALLALGNPATTQAGFLSAFTGNTQMTDSTTKGVVSFAVFANTGGGDFVTAINTALGVSLSASSLPGGGSIDTTAPYVYLYQVVNTTTGTAKIQALYVSDPGSAYTSAGYFAGKVFQDASGVDGGANVNSANPGLGSPNPSSDDVVNGSPSLSGATVGSIVAGGVGTKDATDSDVAFGGDGGGHVTFTWANAAQLSKGQWSSVVFLTSKVAPQYAEGLISGGSGQSNGDIPAATPEPASMSMVAVGLLFFGGFFGWRRRATRLALQS